MAEFGLAPQAEVNPLFRVAWVRIVWGSGRAETRLVAPLEPCLPPPEDTDSARVRSWCSQFDGDGPVADAGTGMLWLRYREVVRAVQAE
jgi:hypothetical protein